MCLAVTGTVGVACASIGGEGDQPGVDAAPSAGIDAALPSDAAPPPPDASAPDPIPCEDGDRQDQDEDGGCYFLFESAVPWLTARMQCRALGADLARIDSAEENDRLFDLAAGLVDVWVGGNDILVEGRWVWLDDPQEIAPPLYSRWRAGEPNDSGVDGEDCMILEVGKGQREWDDRNCSLRAYPFLCERR